MTTFVLTLDDEQAQEIEDVASRAGISAEIFLRREIDALLVYRREIRRAIAETLSEDAEVYRRLAK